MTRILISIVLAQFLCTSLWFASNAILSDLIQQHNLHPDFLAHLTSAVQIGFITGTLLFALFTIADKFSPSRVFFVCSLIAAAFNYCGSFNEVTPISLLSFRFFTGFFLAGIYPVGMKIASDYYQKGLGKSLGFLVGALVVGTALPHLLKSMATTLPWKYVLYSTSGLSIVGGLAILLFVPDGPFRKSSQAIHFTAFLSGFKNSSFRSAAFGYFGHMWELYAFWAFVPVMIATYNTQYPNENLDVSFLAFVIIASGGLACVLGGLLSQRYGAKKIATLALTLSCACCLLSPLFLFHSSSVLFISFLLFWGMTVVADSPLFSSLVALHAPEETRGTSLTAVTCIGFAITIISIQLVSAFGVPQNQLYIYTLLSAGPIMGLVALLKK
jgi:MFS family permease